MKNVETSPARAAKKPCTTEISKLQLPQDVDTTLRIGGFEIWLFDPGRSLYKIYSGDEGVIRVLRNAPARLGVKEGATYSKGGRVVGRDFLVRFADMAGVLRHLEGNVKAERKSAKTSSFSAPKYELSHRRKAGCPNE